MKVLSDEKDPGTPAKSQIDIDLPKEKKPAAALVKAAGKIGLKGANQGGKWPEHDHMLADLPDELHYGGHRTRQVLHHFSEVMRWHLETSGFAPVEVQAQYLKRKGMFHLAVSANQHASQVAMAKMTNEDLVNMYEAAVKSDNPRARLSAEKILRIQAQNRQRRVKSAELAAARKRGDEVDDNLHEENEADLQDAASLALMMRNRQRYSVVINRRGRHAEQNLRKAFKDTFGEKDPENPDTKDDEGDVAGTLIRCGACSAAMGPDHRLGRMLLRAGYHGRTIGKFYASQATARDWSHLFEDIKSGDTKVFTGASRRRMSFGSPIAPRLYDKLRNTPARDSLDSPSAPGLGLTASPALAARRRTVAPGTPLGAYQTRGGRGERGRGGRGRGGGSAEPD